MENSKIIIGYLIYLPIVIALTIYVSKMLFKNGKLFMVDIFKGKEDIALATNKLFEIGFYLINIGFAFLGTYLSITHTIPIVAAITTTAVIINVNIVIY